MRYRSLASYHPRYIHQFPYKSIRVIAKGSAVLPSRKSAKPFSSYKVIFQHPQAIRAIRHVRIKRILQLLSFCYQTGSPVLKKCVFSRFCSPSHPLFHYSHSVGAKQAPLAPSTPSYVFRLPGIIKLGRLPLRSGRR